VEFEQRALSKWPATLPRELQFVEQLPQWKGSVVSIDSHWFAGIKSQSAVFVEQFEMPHIPEEQVV